MEREPHELLGISRFAPWPDVRSAYRALARRFHPDGSAPDAGQMAALNAAYEALERRRANALRQPAVPMGPGSAGAGMTGQQGVSSPAGPETFGPPPGPPTGSLLWRVNRARHVDTPVLDFGQYAGWRIAEVADHDPRYLVWLSRHSSGVRFRRSIEQVIGSNPDVGRQAAVLG